MKSQKNLFSHQVEALNILKSKYNDFEKKTAALIVVPTGGGKTQIAVSWLKELKPYTFKIIWFAQSFELLNQANKNFEIEIPELKKLIISSHRSHNKVKDISEDENLIIITTNTAIKNLKQEDNPLKNFINKNKDNLFILILDEAHHSPAEGCKKMLNNLFNELKKCWLLGLTATPTYTDRKRRGWLWKIFSDGIIYEVSKEILQKQKILANENYIQKKIPNRVNISDEEFKKIIKYSTDVPEHIVEELASNQKRNDFIINEYLNNKNKYGKTIIFLDRWFQCEYIKKKLIEHNILADAVYYQNNNNKLIIEQFKKNTLQVLLNVKILTEGTDIPDVQTIFITRQTNSHILLRQMIGRGLRGVKTGGLKLTANIVLFGDNWNKSIAWAKPDLNGGIEEKTNKIRTNILEKIRLDILESIINQIKFKRTSIENYNQIIPSSWYEIEYIYFKKNKSLELIKDYIIIKENEERIWNILISALLKDNDIFWENENLNLKEGLIKIKLTLKKLNINVNKKDAFKMAMFIGQNKTIPKHINFLYKDKTSLDYIEHEIKKLDYRKQKEFLLNEYKRHDKIWGQLFKDFNTFSNVINLYINKIPFLPNKTSFSEIFKENITELNRKEKIKAIKLRDKNTCLACGLTSKETKLVVSEILEQLNYFEDENLQTLCTRCNKLNQAYQINFLNKNIIDISDQKKFKEIEFDLKFEKNLSRIKAAIKAAINFLYLQGVTKDIKISRRRNSKNYETCQIFLIQNSNLKLLNNNKIEILNFINKTLNQKHIQKLEFFIYKEVSK